MRLAKSGQIGNVCQPNALMTLKEYLLDYASEGTRDRGEEVIAEEIERIKHPIVKQKAQDYIDQLEGGKRDFRF